MLQKSAQEQSEWHKENKQLKGNTSGDDSVFNSSSEDNNGPEHSAKVQNAV